VKGRVVVLGGGAVAEAFCVAYRRLDPEAPMTLVERNLVGGECTYWACMPSKTLLRAPELVAAAGRTPGAAEAVTGPADVERIFWWRDQVVDNHDDAGHLEWLAEHSVDFVRGTGRVRRPGVLEVDGDDLEYERLVVATGSTPAIPPLEGLDRTEYWTNKDATATSEVPGSLVIIGAGPVGCELGQFFARVGSRVTILDVHLRLLPREDPEASELLMEAFREEGIDLRLGTPAERVEAPCRLRLEDGSMLEAERLLIASGRIPNSHGLGLEQLGVRVAGRGGIVVDERLQAAENVWAIGDVNGIAMLTHVGKYQARVAAVNVAGGEARADYRAIPAVTFTDPQIGSVGTRDGDGIVSTKRKLPSRATTYERPRPDGFLKLFADAQRGVLVGATAVGPEAGEWLQQLTLAIRAEVPIDVLRDTIQPFPTFSEAITFAARDLEL
jgi:pyruvate/2-oxoglutarate dehydrogenase complex dihydrolipoamide dehydrogenase (E3) component